jgi:peptide/nickel transport system permease protein
MVGYLLKRLGLAVLTLIILGMIIFIAGQVLPGNPAREILGRSASQAAVNALNRKLGLDKPLPLQYWDWVSRAVRGNLGMSYQYQAPVSQFLWSAVGRSLKLAAVALVMVVPLSILGGVIAALNRGKIIDRVISTVGLSLATLPEFVTGTILIVIFAIELRWLPVDAQSEGSFFAVLPSLVLPALALVCVLFGYIARMARAGTVEALESDYVRTATMKGLPRRTVIFRHVLRNSLLPTITVIATETGYLIGGLVVVETLFDYPGLGSLIFNAAQNKDFPMLEAGVLVIGVVYLSVTLIADVLYTVLTPRLRLQGAG